MEYADDEQVRRVWINSTFERLGPGADAYAFVTDCHARSTASMREDLKARQAKAAEAVLAWRVATQAAANACREMM